MRIHALTTGTVSLKHAFLHAADGPLRQVRLFTPGPFSDPVPIHVWVVEHDGRRILVDTGEVATAPNVPFARFAVEPGEELPGAIAAAGLRVADIDTVVLTHMHSDHVDGVVHLGDRPVLVHDAELEFQHSATSRLFQKVLRQPLPAARYEPMKLDGGALGAFAASRALTDDGRVAVVATPGHTPGHVSVLCVDDDGKHVLLAGDTTDTLEQLRARRTDAVSPKPKVTVETIDRILAHGAQHPLVYLPSHDMESAARLEGRVTL